MPCSFSAGDITLAIEPGTLRKLGKARHRAQARVEIREILERLAETHGATARDVTVAMRSIDNTLGDLLYDQERALQHEMEDLTPG